MPRQVADYLIRRRDFEEEPRIYEDFIYNWCHDSQINRVLPEEVHDCDKEYRVGLLVEFCHTSEDLLDLLSVDAWQILCFTRTKGIKIRKVEYMPLTSWYYLLFETCVKQYRALTPVREWERPIKLIHYVLVLREVRQARSRRTGRVLFDVLEL